MGAVNAQAYVELRESRGATVRRVQDGWMVTCPAHDDRNPSLHVSEHDGRVLLSCHARCPTAQVKDADGLEWGDLFVDGVKRNGRVEVAAYDYVDERGELLFQCVRFRPKAFKQRQPDGRGGWVWNLKGVRRVLYRLPAVSAAVAAGATVYVVEGEKDVQAIERAGAVATCNPMGAGKGKWHREYTDTLRGADVVVVADRDEEGREHARRIVSSLAGVAASVAVVEAAVGKDVSDHLAAGHGLAQLVAVVVDGTDEQGSCADDTTTTSDRERARETLRELDVERLIATAPAPVPFVLEPMLVEGCVTMLAGREGRGKSMLALAIAAALGRGALLLDVAGMSVGLGGRVLYIDAENGEPEIHRRLHGLSVQSGKLAYVEADGFDLRRELARVERLIAKHEPRLLVLDSMRSLAPGLDENDSQEVEAALRPVVRLTQRLGISTLILHHASRGSGEYRGSTAIGAAVELGFTLARIDGDPMAGTRRRLTCWKSRPAPEPPERWLTIKRGDGGEILLFEAAPYEPQREAPARDEIEQALRDLVEGCQVPGGAKGGGTLAPPPWTTAALARAVGREPKDGTVRRAIQRLEEAGLLCRNGDGWYPNDGREAGEEQDR
jgi:5S rRNA maturation endonuclease (ribonuclease M5)